MNVVQLTRKTVDTETQTPEIQDCFVLQFLFLKSRDNWKKAGIGRAVVDLSVKELDVFRPSKSERLVVVDEGKAKVHLKIF